MDVDLDGATWRKSDSKQPEGPILVFTRDQWRAFVQGIEAGELGAELQPGRVADICREGPRHDPLTR